MSLQSQEIVDFQLTERQNPVYQSPRHNCICASPGWVLQFYDSFGNSSSEMSRFRMQIVDGKCWFTFEIKARQRGSNWRQAEHSTAESGQLVAYSLSRSQQFQRPVSVYLPTSWRRIYSRPAGTISGDSSTESSLPPPESPHDIYQQLRNSPSH